MNTRKHLPVRAAIACLLVGNLLSGVGILPSFAAEPNAEEWYAEGQQYLKGEGVPQDAAKAFALLQKAADQGHADAFAALGYCYSAGIGVEKSEEQARRCFEQGAGKGSVAAQSNLGFFLIKGRGGAPDAARGVALMEKAIQAGSQKTAVLLGEVFYFGQHADGQPDYAKAHAVLIAPARAGDPVAQNMVGVMLKDGRLGEKALDTARVWFEKAALQGNGKACHNLAELWNYRSPDRWARIEALRWLAVGEGLNETMAYYFLEDIKDGVAADELQAARQLAEITLSSVIRKPGTAPR